MKLKKKKKKDAVKKELYLPVIWIPLNEFDRDFIG
jgi:hypothetical protein